MIHNIHAAHQGTTSLLSRACQLMYWPGMDRDIQTHSDSCEDCRKAAPSKVREPLEPTEAPDYPFQHVASDLFEIDGHHYLVYVDHLTAFAELAYYPSAPSSSKLISTFREFFHRWGVVEKISLDGGPNLDSHEMKEWLKKWGVTVRQSSAYYPQSNGRAEAGVKSLKRLLMGNTGSNGTINTDAVAQALLQYRNTPLRDVKKSPAELALGRQLRDTIPLPRHRYKVSPHWSTHLHNREKAISDTSSRSKEQYDQHSMDLQPLKIGDRVRVQNTRSKPKKWDRTGEIKELNGHRQYTVKMDGSGRLSIRNRRHLSKVVERPTPLIFHPSAEEVACPVVPDASAATTPDDLAHLVDVAPPPLAQEEGPSSSNNPIAPNAASTQHYVRRSDRRSVKPKWYHQEFNS